MVIVQKRLTTRYSPFPFASVPPDGARTFIFEFGGRPQLNRPQWMNAGKPIVFQVIFQVCYS
jgi:hypothetical protein